MCNCFCLSQQSRSRAQRHALSSFHWSACKYLCIANSAKFKNSRDGKFLKAIQKSCNHSTYWPCLKVKSLLVVSKACILARVLNRWSWITLGQMHSFSSSGSGDTDRWHINEGLCATCQCPRCPNLEKRCICPKVIQLHLLRTLVRYHLPIIDMNDMKKPPRYLCKPLHGYATEINSKVLINNELINVEIRSTPQEKQTNKVTLYQI